MSDGQEFGVDQAMCQQQSGTRIFFRNLVQPKANEFQHVIVKKTFVNIVLAIGRVATVRRRVYAPRRLLRSPASNAAKTSVATPSQTFFTVEMKELDATYFANERFANA
jgi:hypothetical protein